MKQNARGCRLARFAGWTLGAAWLALVPPGARYAQAEAPAAAAPAVIAAVRFEAASGGAIDARLRERLARSDIARLLLRPEVGPAERERLIREAPTQLAEILATAGHFSPVISVSTQGGAVVVQIDPGPVARVRTLRLTLEGETEPEASALLDRLLARFPLPEGSAFDDERWREGKALVEGEFRAAGYLDARVAASAAEVDAAVAVVDLSVTLAPGPLARFEGLAIRGLARLPQALIERLNPLAPGEPLTAEAIARFEQRIRASGLVSGVAILTDRGPGTRPRAMLEVNLTEAPEHRLLLGPGYSTVGGPRLTAEHQWLRLPGLPAQAQTRLTWARDDGSFVSEVSSYALAENWRVLGSLAIGRTELTGLTMDRRRVRAGAEWRARDERDRWLVAAEWVDNPVRSPAETLSASAVLLDFAWARDRLDDRRFPMAGRALALDLSLGLTTSGENKPFARVLVRGSEFWPFAHGGFAQARLEVGQIVGARSARIPQAVLFRAGGEGSVRGYGTDGLGVPSPGYVAGGRFLATGTLEYAHPLPWQTGRLFGTVFVDAGGASERLADYRAQGAIGAGVRWASPIGALSAHLAWAEARRKVSLGFTVGVRF